MSVIKTSDIKDFEKFKKYCYLVENSVHFNKIRNENKPLNQGNCFDGEVEHYQFLKNFAYALIFIRDLYDRSSDITSTEIFENFFELLKIFFGYEDSQKNEINTALSQISYEMSGDKIYAILKPTCIADSFSMLVGTQPKEGAGKTWGGTILTVTDTIRTKTKIVEYDNYNLDSIYWWNDTSNKKNKTVINGLYGISSGIKYVNATVNFSDFENSSKNLVVDYIGKYNPFLSSKSIKQKSIIDACFPFDNYSLIDNFFPDPTSNEKWEEIFCKYYGSVGSMLSTHFFNYYQSLDKKIILFTNNSTSTINNIEIKCVEEYCDGAYFDYDSLALQSTVTNLSNIISYREALKLTNVSTSIQSSEIIKHFSSRIYYEGKKIPDKKIYLNFYYITNMSNMHMWNRFKLTSQEQIEKIKEYKIDYNIFKSNMTLEDQTSIENYDISKTEMNVSDIIGKINYDHKDLNNYSIKNDPKYASELSLLRYSYNTFHKDAATNGLSLYEILYDSIEKVYDNRYNRNQLACMLLLIRALYKNDYNWAQYIKEEYGLVTEDQSGSGYGTTTYSLVNIGVEKPYEKIMKDSLTQKLMNPQYAVYKNTDEKEKNDKIVDSIKSAMWGRDLSDKRTSAIVPIDVNVTVDGIGGLRSGDAIDLDFLPQIYKDNIVLSISNISHEIGNDWTTTLNLIIKTRLK